MDITDKIHSSIGDVELFLHSHIWKDMEQYLKDSLEVIRMELAVVEDIREIYKLQGAHKVAEKLLLFPHSLIEDIKAQNINKEQGHRYERD